MAFHIACYSASIANGTVLLQITNIADPIIATSGLGFLVNGSCPNLMRVFAAGTNLTRVQLTSGTLRKYAPFDLNPVNVGTLINTPAALQDWSDNPIPLKVNEELDAFGVQSNAGAQRINLFVTFCDVKPSGPANPEFTMHWTASATLTANAWSAITPVFDNGLPSGTFLIVGSRQISASALAHRFIPRGGAALRPGSFSAQAQGGSYGPITHGEFTSERGGGLGTWMQFTNTTIPQIEIFATAADTTEEGYIDMVQIA